MSNERIAEAETILSVRISKLDEAPDSKQIQTLIDDFRPVLINVYNLQDDDFTELRRALEVRHVTTMGKGTSLINQEVQHDDDWYRTSEIKWNHWEGYRTFLTDAGWSGRVVASLDVVTGNILGLLKDPREEGEWERRGLVIGHVQSGKTANYIGVLSRAADAGYRFIVVIAGIHNALRTQTQERIDAAFIGRDSRSKEVIGVGRLARGTSRMSPVTVTTVDSDFNTSTARKFNVELTSLRGTFILVIKKNASTLSNLYSWLKDLNTRDGLQRISDIPMLLIDDEADNASINTNRPDLNPTRINREIRNILRLFRKRCYVGYTATPFANIFINPDDNPEAHGNDLFPEHFIYALDAPTNYQGYEKIFLEDSGKQAFIRDITDAEAYIPLKHAKDLRIEQLPPSLKNAIRLFLLSRTVRNLRGQESSHCSMLINVSRFVAVQRELKQMVDLYLERLSRVVKYNCQLPVEKAMQEPVIAQFFDDFVREYGAAGPEWAIVLRALGQAAGDAQTALINSKSDQSLLYTKYARDGNARTVIAIGGLSLSRGLTIEGLTISYIHRNTKMYDTLLQMGRWFGYREGYADLCRVFMSPLSYEWYNHIAQATEELREQIKRMRREDKKPGDFGLYVRSHPDTLTVTAINKMYHTEIKDFQISYDGQLKETYILPANDVKRRANQQLLIESFTELKDEYGFAPGVTGAYLCRDVPASIVSDIIRRFRFHDSFLDLRESLPIFIDKAAADDSLFARWDIIFQSLANAPVGESSFPIAAQRRSIGMAGEAPRIPLREPGWYTGNRSRFSGNSMFRAGLDEAQLGVAEALAKEADRGTPIFRDYTNARKRPVLILHLLHLTQVRDGKDLIVSPDNPALSVSFPGSSRLITVKYTVNPVWRKMLEQEGEGNVADGDDYES